MDCLRQEPDNPWTHMAIANLFLEDHPQGTAEGERAAEAAEAAATRSLELFPDYGMALTARGVARSRLGKTQAAWEDLSRSLALAPDPRKQVVAGMLCADLGRRVEAEKLLREAAAAAAEDPMVLTALGTFLARFGRPREAIPVLERAVELAPCVSAASGAAGWAGSRDALVNLGLARIAGGDLHGVHELRTAAAAAAAQRDAGALYRAGVGMTRAGEGEEAIRLFQAALEVNPRLGAAYDALGTALIAAGREEDARRLGERMRQLGLAPGGELGAWLGRMAKPQ